MGGEGKRFSSSLPKQFHRLSGKKVYLYTLETFVKSQLFKEIILVCHKSYIDEIANDIQALRNTSSPIRVIAGSDTRQLSSEIGIKSSLFDYVLIHDAVRPFVSLTILEDNIEALKKFDACDTCIPSADTIVHSKDQELITSIPDRSKYLRGQTPQSFKKDLLIKAHENALKNNITNASDDCQLITTDPIHIVKGSETNIKITSSFDLCIAEHLLRLKVTPLNSIHKTSLKGKTYVVTGATGGIGQEICNLLESENATIIRLSLSSSEHPIDLTDFNSSKILFEKLEKTYGAFDGLINSVGYLKISPLKNLKAKDLSDLIDKNFTALTHSCKLCPLKEEAHIINIASSSYSRGRENYAIYSAMKAAVVNFTQGLSEEMPKLSINSIIPPRTQTDMRLKNFPKENLSTLLHPKHTAEKVVEILKVKNMTGMTVEIKKGNET